MTKHMKNKQVEKFVEFEESVKTDSSISVAKETTQTTAQTETIESDLLFDINLSTLNKDDEVFIDNRKAFVIVDDDNYKSLCIEKNNTNTIKYIRLISNTRKFRELQQQIYERFKIVILHQHELFNFLLSQVNLILTLDVRESKIRADNSKDKLFDVYKAKCLLLFKDKTEEQTKKEMLESITLKDYSRKDELIKVVCADLFFKL